VPDGLAARLERYRLERQKRLSGHFSAFLPHIHDNKPLFELPQNMVKVFNQDLAFAESFSGRNRRQKRRKKKVFTRLTSRAGPLIYTP
jgi:hypothetical protein